ncbi:IS110 family transposase [Paenibacillus alginolyticus]|uniref:IS110 family transposase n=1 Tax=Paenibacillus alginolyticus TaxID=59839 RepID=A0ABT4GJQ1_9BACL|nr:IS110 family transposase [Paenibacillus alginolyticus]MCY9696416.1 IS110 family transposase [Paenibacillus alginolyticus]
MKFKAQDKQNQLIENITANHLVVGVDIAQETHVARAVNFRGIALGNPLEFSNDEVGFRSLDRWIRDLLASYKLSQIIVGMEPTGHYWLALAHWLKDTEIEAVLVNPHLVKKNKENRDNTRSKSDKKDALVIVKRLVSAVNQIHRWVDIVFPELRQVFKILTCKGALETLRLFPLPADLSKLEPNDVIAGWKKSMKRHSGVRRAKLLIDLAKKSVGSTQATYAYKLHLEHLLEEYDLANTQLQRIEAEAKAVLERIPYASKILAITGISAIALAGVLGESGDLSGYIHGNTLLRHAGLNLTEASSGKWKGQMTLSKRGRPRLRHFLYLITMCMVMTNKEFKALHQHNVQVKKLKKMKSIMKLCGKLARLLVGLARSEEAYNPVKVFALAA